MIAPSGERNPLLDHAWGLSPAADRVWAQISGIAPSTKPWGRLFVVFQAFMDDSYTPNGTFVLGGYVASAEAWAAFAKEWESLLPLATRNRRTRAFRFKMSEMAQFMDRVPTFHNVIADHALLALSCKINLADLRRARERIWGDNLIIDWNFADRPFSFCYAGLMGTFHSMRIKHDPSGQMAGLLPLDQKVDFYFDMQSEREEIQSAWENFKTSESDDIEALYGALPRFENDEEFLPLQAADFWAWWVRKGYETDKLFEYKYGRFDGWETTKLVPFIDIFFTEDTIVEHLIERVRDKIGPDRPLYDAKTHPRPS